jgi:hypothetical protein
MSWRKHIRARLSAGQPVVAGELFEEVCDQIPLHHAARNVTTRVARHGPMPVVRMRWFAFAREVMIYSVTCDPPVYRHKRGALTQRTVVTPATQPCQRCGEAFFGPRTKAYCTVCMNVQRGWRRGMKQQPELREAA